LSYRDEQKKKAKSLRLAGIALISGVIVIVFSVIGLRVYLESNALVIDDSTLCPMSGSPEYVAIIFDKSDAYNPVQQAFLNKFFTDFKNTLQVHAQISLFVISDQTVSSIKPAFTICNPESGENANSLYQNPAMIAEKWKKQFSEPLDRAIIESLEPSASDTSPILEMIQIASLTAFPPLSKGKTKRIILISDMLHNTSEWSQYRGDKGFSMFKATEYYRQIQTNLDGAAAQILYVRRDGFSAIQNRGHVAFWEEYFLSMQGRLTDLIPVEG
jgi:hypothetical protein